MKLKPMSIYSFGAHSFLAVMKKIMGKMLLDVNDVEFDHWITSFVELRIRREWCIE